METVVVRWSVELETWFVSDLTQAAEERFDDWAAKQSDLTQLRFVLQGENYVCRWLNLPGVQGRHLPKALPFALEESLIEDISQYHLVTAGKVGKFNHRVYCGLADQLKRLLEACDHRHLTARQLIPETSLIPDNSLVHHGHFWFVNIQGLGEAKVHESAVAAYLEGLCNDLQPSSYPGITVIDTNLDTANLLKTQIDSNFAGIFSSVNVELGDFKQLREQSLNNKCVDLLTAEFRPAEIKQDKPSAWWQPIALLAACWGAFSFVQITIENQQLIAQQKYVQGQTVALYKQLFPGERLRFLERQIRGKIKGDSTVVSAGVMTMLSQASLALQKNGLNEQVEWQSFRFNDRQNELIIDLTAKTLAQLQGYKAALEQQGLSVEIAQASNDNNRVKGRLKIGAAA